MAQSIDPTLLQPEAASSTSSGATVDDHHATSNGHSNGTGHVDAMDYDGESGFKPLWEGSDVDRREFVRIALQALEEIGYQLSLSHCLLALLAAHLLLA